MSTETLVRPATFAGVTPRLQVSDVVRSAEFFRDKLGFSIDSYLRKPPIQALLQRDKVRLILDAAPDGRVTINHIEEGADLEFVVDDLHSTIAELEERGVTFYDDAVLGLRNGFQMRRIKDQDGHLIAFVEQT